MKKFQTSFRTYGFVCAFLSALAIFAKTPDYGMHIKSYPEPGNRLTTVMLDGGQQIPLNGKDLTLSFSLWLRPENALGTVVRIITDHGRNVDLLYSIEDEQRYPNLVTGDIANLQTTLPKYNEWVPVTMTISPSTGNVELNYNGTITTTSYPDLKGAKSVRIVMGLSNIEGFVLNDVASVNVKDVSVTIGKDQIRMWRFKAHLEDRCLDEIHNQPATVVNPQWIVDEAASWNKIFDSKFSGLPSVAFDPVIASFYMVSSNSNKLLVFHSPEGVTDTIVTTGLPHLADSPNQLIFIPRQHILLSYNIDEDRFAKFDPVDHSWCNGGVATKDHDFWNNSVSYNPKDSTLVSFGGYGHYKFNNLMVTCYPFSEREQKSVSLSEIHPRRSCATTIVGNHLYIFGGWGCPSGRQELDTRNYYDMHRVNLANNSVELLWNLGKSPFGADFVCLENMIYDPESDSFLMLSTLDNGTLLKVKRNTGEMEKLSYPMELKIDSHLFYGNFYFSQEQNKYYAAIVCSQTDGVTNLSIYTLPAPAMPLASLTQEYKEATANSSKSYIFMIIIGVALVVLLTLLWHNFRQNKRNRQREVSVNKGDNNDPAQDKLMDHDENNQEETVNQEDKNEENLAIVEDTQQSDIKNYERQDIDEKELVKYYDLSHSCVRLFGSFQVFDKNGLDITSAFTPTLKQLLLVLILYTGKNPNGISSNKLLDIIWGDKEYESAKNNRNVYLSRLRPLLQQIGDVTLGSQNGFRNIRFGEGTICDYLELLKLMKEKNPDDTDRILELLFNGMLLPNVESDYVDPFKSNFSNEAIDFLTKLLHQRNLSLKQKVKISDTIFQHDFVNEEALYAKCLALHQQGRTGMARAAYDAFCKEYKILMGKPYHHSFSEIIEGPV